MPVFPFGFSLKPSTKGYPPEKEKKHIYIYIYMYIYICLYIYIRGNVIEGWTPATYLFAFSSPGARSSAFRLTLLSKAIWPALEPACERRALQSSETRSRKSARPLS